MNIKELRNKLDNIADELEDLGLEQSNQDKEYKLDEAAQSIRDAVDSLYEYLEL